jgi:hypothetical protein
MLHWHANIKKDVLALRVVDDFTQHFPTMLIEVKLKEVIETAIAGDFKFGADAKSGALLFGDDD